MATWTCANRRAARATRGHVGTCVAAQGASVESELLARSVTGASWHHLRCPCSAKTISSWYSDGLGAGLRMRQNAKRSGQIHPALRVPQCRPSRALDGLPVASLRSAPPSCWIGPHRGTEFIPFELNAL
jgi:hypothetical protein